VTEVRLIVGPPGTGKTRALTQEAETAAAKTGPTSVAICSLTKTAAEEIASRAPVPDDQVGTLHSHCYHALDRPELAETAEGIREWSAAHPEFKLTGARGALDELDAGTQVDEGGRTQADGLHQAVMNHRARMVPRDQWRRDERDYATRWDDFKTQTKRLDFTDLIEQAIANTDGHPAAPHILLGDEAQDFSALELALFRHWARHTREAVLCADPLQVLYSWRGADPHAFDRIPESSTRYLRQSYRLPAAVHAAAVGWAQGLGLEVPDYRPRPAAGAIQSSGHSLRNPDQLVAQIADQVAGGQTAMVLDSCSFMLPRLLWALKDAGLPFHNPLRPKRGAWNPLRGGGRLAAFLRPQDEVWGEKARAWTWGDLRAWTEPLAAKDTLTRGSKALIEEKCREDKLGSTREYDEVPLETVLELLGTTDLRHPALRCDVDWWQSRLRAKARDQMRYPLQVARTLGGKALLEKPRVIVGTIHSVKGGEADHVYLSPDLSKAAMWEGWAAGGPGREAIARTFYVGLSRAREQVTVLSPAAAEHVPVEQLVGDQVAMAA
jgi:ATP-dependent DNA helicase UvrD/PcrA